MADEKNKPGGQERQRININEDRDLLDWSKKYRVTPARLKAAIAKVGTFADDVEKKLKK